MTQMTAAGLTAYLENARRELPTCDTLVIGHTAPDADTVISSLFEAWRRTLAGDPATPVVQAAAMPTECAWLCGEWGGMLPLAAEPAAAQRLSSPQVSLVLTDHHDEPGHMERVRAIVDHHLPTAGETLPPVETEIAPVGAATTLVARRCREQGLIPDEAVARLLLGAILMDTEGLSASKAKAEDREIAAWLIALSGEQPQSLFAALRERLLAETDPDTLYWRDHRVFGRALGFAVLKTRVGTPPDETRVRALLEKERQQTGLTACLAKIVRYGDTAPVEEIYLISADTPTAGKLAETIAAASGEAAMISPADRVTVPIGGRFLSRKRLTPLLLPLLTENPDKPDKNS